MRVNSYPTNIGLGNTYGRNLPNISVAIGDHAFEKEKKQKRVFVLQ